MSAEERKEVMDSVSEIVDKGKGFFVLASDLEENLLQAGSGMSNSEMINIILNLIEPLSLVEKTVLALEMHKMVQND